eukprot:EC120326.1.p1 GENE.EC120326.1~~EC120326.1.p1  ORF type:complete len:135 (+),score=3.08 EC120326.1:37-441(+)
MSETALRLWLYFLASLRLLAVYLSLFDRQWFEKYYALAPEKVNDVFGRVFASWTSTTAMLCIFCASNITSRPIYIATLGSFVIAFFNMSMELLVFRTVVIKTAIMALVPAGVSILWMSVGWSSFGRSTSKSKHG